MKNGQEYDIRAGDCYEIQPEHDTWVVGEPPTVCTDTLETVKLCLSHLDLDPNKVERVLSSSVIRIRMKLENIKKKETVTFFNEIDTLSLLNQINLL